MPGRRKFDLHPWEHALACPLPCGMDYSELKDLQNHLLGYLRHLPHDFTLGHEERDAEIQRVADRLKIISRMIADASPVVETTGTGLERPAAAARRPRPAPQTTAPRARQQPK
jgi:hypothetical protein